MKKNMKKFSIILFLFIAVASFIIFINSALSVGTTTYGDWGSIEKLDNIYSYSTIFLTQNTQFYILKNDGENNPAKVSGINKSFPQISKLSPGDEFSLLITNCGVDQNDDLMDVVVKIDNIQSFNISGRAPEVRFWVLTEYTLPTSQTDPSKHDIYDMKLNQPLMFYFYTNYARADFTITYYKAGYNRNTNSGTLANIQAVNGLYWDFDINGSDSLSGKFLGGSEGFVPKVGTSKILYNKNKKNEANYGGYPYTLQEINNGIAVDKSSGSDINDQVFWWATSALSLTTGLNSSYSFTYGGSSCGLRYMFASPYPFETDKPKKTANKTEVLPGESFEYTVTQYVPNNYFGTLFTFNEIYKNLYENSQYNSFKITDTIDSHLTINQGNIRVLNEEGTNVTSYFNISISGNTVTATVKSNMFSDLNFYTHTYKLIIPVTLKADTQGIDKVQNAATTTFSLCKDASCPTEDRKTDNVDVKVKYRLNVNYYEDGKSGSKVATSDPETYYYYGNSYSTNYNKVDLKVWQFVRSDGDATSGSITKNTTVNYYFVRRPYVLTVNYLEEGTNIPIDNMPADVTNPLYFDGPYNTNYNKVNQNKWKIVRSEVQQGEGTIAGDKTISGKIKEDTIINYYFEKIPYGLTVNYLEEGTNNVIADPDVTKPIYYDDKYTTNHDKIEHRMWRIVRSEVETGEGEVTDENNKTIEGTIVGNTVINYYFEKIEYPVTVNYYDAQTKEAIDESDKTIYYFDMDYYTNYDKIDRDVWEYVSNDGDPIEGVITGEQESYTINYYFNRLKYRLLVSYFDDKTKQKIALSDKYVYNYQDEYLTSYDKIDSEYWEYVRTEGENPGIIYEDTEVDYYFKNNEYTLEVNYYDEETGEKIDDPDISSHKYGDEYTTNDDKIDKKKWELVEVPENAEGTVDGDLEVNYYYKKREYKLIINYYEEGTENKIVESSESIVYYGDKYITDYNKVDEKVWTLVSMPENYQGEILEDTTVNYYFKQVEIKNPQTGANQNNITKIIIPSIVLIVIATIAGIMYRILLKKKIYKI